MNGLHEAKMKKTRKIWILGMILGLMIILGIGSYFLIKANREKQYTGYMEKADNYFSIKNYDKAIIAYRSAIEVNKKEYRPYEGLSEVYIIQGEYSQARIILKEGIEATDSNTLKNILTEIAGIADGKEIDNLQTKLEEDATEDQWNLSLIGMISEYTYIQYSKEYGTGVVNTQGNGCVIHYDALGMKAYYEKDSDEAIMNGATGLPFDGTIPSYVVFDDLSFLFYQCGNGMGMDEIQKIIGVEPEIKSSEEGGWYLDFQYLNCEFQIACGEDGYIEDPYAKNKVIPLADSSNEEMGTVTGIIIDAVTGEVLEDMTVNFRTGFGAEEGNVVLSSSSDMNGEISVSVPADTYTLEFVKDGYITEYEEIVVQKGAKADFGTKTVSPNLGEGEWRIVLEWGDTPADLDSHLVTDSYHVSYINPVAGSKASLDVDDRDGRGPETITITEFDIEEHYDYYVHDYTNSGQTNSNALQNSGATVKVYMPNGDTREYSVPGGSGYLWHVFSIDKGEINEIGDINSGDV